MPLYEYHCETCDSDFELRRPMSASEEPTQCPRCESLRTTRQISLFATFTKGAAETRGAGGGCGCGGACACGGQGMN